jgi:hypothetical protein
MSAILKQRNLFVTKRFEIAHNCIKVAIKSPISYFEDEIAFEDIGRKSIRKKSHNLFLLIPGLLAIVGVIVTVYSHFFEEKGSSAEDILVYLVLAILFLTISAFAFENVITFTTYNYKIITFYANSPVKVEVDNFVEQMLAQQKKYLLNRYGKADPYLSSEQLAVNLKWLRDRNVINDAELDELRIKILPKPGGSSVGFQFNPGSN